MIKWSFKTKLKVAVGTFAVLLYAFCLPSELFDQPTSTVITSRSGKLLGAQIANDGQWRFPKSDSIPYRFKECLLHFEDQYFNYHPGFNPIAIGRAIVHNISSKNSVRGASTITQQVIRMSRNNPPRSYSEKLIELILATRLELRHSKKDILKLWACNAPFGGNVVGLEAAAWRYYQRSPEQLSWAESATLAVLPNAPSLIFPGRNQDKLLDKRNRLLSKLLANGILDSLSYELALEEPLPLKPHPLPQLAPHLLQRMHKQYAGERSQVTVDYHIQDKVNTIAQKHYYKNQQNGIHNLAVMVMDVNTKEVLAYVGNSNTTSKHQKDVDIITKPRSTGSILKPFLYAGMLDGGELLPETLVFDIPTQIGAYRPENFDRTYSGAVPADEALAKSLNIPAVRMLRKYGIDRFYNDLKENGFTTINRPADDYGLSLILGGAEASLWDLAKNYAALAGTLNEYSFSQQYNKFEWQEPILKLDQLNNTKNSLVNNQQRYSAAASYFTLESLKKVNRPSTDQHWEYFQNSQQIAWKTGTSFGFRDAWSIGVTSKYLVAVWVGNADGEGRPGLVGVEVAAPLMFDVFDIFQNENWSSPPYDELYEAGVCSKSGMLARLACNQVINQYMSEAGLSSQPCSYHRTIHLDQQEVYQVDRSCVAEDKIVTKPWFVLPPVVEHYYAQQNPGYQKLPPFRIDCMSNERLPMALIYPAEVNQIYLPKMMDGKDSELILKATHNESDATLFWYLDRNFLGTTQTFHEMKVQPDSGEYLLTIMDEEGNSIKKQITIKR